MKIYFTGSAKENYAEIIKILEEYGEVLVKPVADKASSTALGKSHDRTAQRFEGIDAVVAEISVPSRSVGYEILKAIEEEKSVLYIHKKGLEKNIPAMTGEYNPGKANIKSYENSNDLRNALNDFFKHPETL